MFIFPGVLYECVFILQAVKSREGGGGGRFQHKSPNEIEKKILIADRVRCQYESPLALPQAKILHESLPALRASIKHSL